MRLHGEHDEGVACIEPPRPDQRPGVVTDLEVRAEADAANQGGKFQVFSGADGSTLGTVLGTAPGANLGFDAVGIGDVDGDGTPDLLVSAATGAVAHVVSGASVIGAP